MTNSDDETPAINKNRVASVWDMHPEMPKVGSAPKIPAADSVPLVAGNGNSQRVLEDILDAVRESLEESRLIRQSGQQTAAHALKAFESLPKLQKRVGRVELIAIGAVVLSVATLVLKLCGR